MELLHFSVLRSIGCLAVSNRYLGNGNQSLVLVDALYLFFLLVDIALKSPRTGFIGGLGFGQSRVFEAPQGTVRTRLTAS